MKFNNFSLHFSCLQFNINFLSLPTCKMGIFYRQYAVFDLYRHWDVLYYREIINMVFQICPWWNLKILLFQRSKNSFNPSCFFAWLWTVFNVKKTNYFQVQDMHFFLMTAINLVFLSLNVIIVFWSNISNWFVGNRSLNFY